MRMSRWLSLRLLVHKIREARCMMIGGVACRYKMHKIEVFSVVFDVEILVKEDCRSKL